MLFWTICAHLYTDAEVGLASALLAAVNLIYTLSLMGFEVSIIRVLHEHPDKNLLFNVCISTSSLLGIIFSLLFFLVLPHYHTDLGVVISNPFNELLFIFFVLISVADYMFNNTFIAYRATKFAMFKNLVFSVGKLLLPFMLVAFGAYGIFSAWMFSLSIAVIYSMVVLSRRFNHTLRPRLGISPLRGILKYSLGNYVSGFAEGLPVIVLPILIVNVYGPEQAAYYYIAMMFATFLYKIAGSATQTLLAEAPHGTQLTVLIRKVLKFLSLLLVPSILFFFVLSPYLLRIFGANYSLGASGLLRILALTAIVNAFNSIARAIFRIGFRTVPLTIVSFLGAGVIIGFSYFFSGFGLNGVGYANFLGEAVSLLIYSAWIFRDRKNLLFAVTSRYRVSKSST